MSEDILDIDAATVQTVPPRESPDMGLPKSEPYYTIDEYLAFERSALERHTYLDGEIIEMSGESDEHADISTNLVGLLFGQLRGKPGRARTKDTKVRSGPIPMLGASRRGMFSYPDIVVICGEPEHHDANRDLILNPTVIIEVLSPSTEDFGRGEKLRRYQTYNPTLRDYLIV